MCLFDQFFHPNARPQTLSLSSRDPHTTSNEHLLLQDEMSHAKLKKKAQP